MDLGGLVIINVYVPNGGGSRDPDNPRVDAKCTANVAMEWHGDMHACSIPCSSADNDIVSQNNVHMLRCIYVFHVLLITIFVSTPGRFLAALRAHADALVGSGKRVLLVGDFNMAAGPLDVHPKAATYDTMYSDRERRVFASLLDRYCDAWRQRHPDTDDVFTVWDEYTAARPFNHVCVGSCMDLDGGLLHICLCRACASTMHSTHPTWPRRCSTARSWTCLPSGACCRSDAAPVMLLQ